MKNIRSSLLCPPFPLREGMKNIRSNLSAPPSRFGKGAGGLGQVSGRELLRRYIFLVLLARVCGLKEPLISFSPPRGGGAGGVGHDRRGEELSMLTNESLTLIIC